jgi:hypothetical protein
MKVYLYDTENGLFEGETFEDPKMLQYEEGVTPVPPPEYERGHVPVFDRSRNEWSVIPITVAKQQLNISTAKSTESEL